MASRRGRSHCTVVIVNNALDTWNDPGVNTSIRQISITDRNRQTIVDIRLRPRSAERRWLLHGARSCRSTSPARKALSSKPADRCCCCRLTVQTDGRKSDHYIDPKDGSLAEWLACWTRAQKARVQIAAAMLSGNSLRQTVHTHCASVHQATKLAAALLRVSGVTANLAESNGSLPPGLWLMSPAGWLQRTGISSGTLRSVIEYGLPLDPVSYAMRVASIIVKITKLSDVLARTFHKRINAYNKPAVITPDNCRQYWLPTALRCDHNSW